eukprot:6149433-Amphidinium_carterae.1
MSYNGLIESVTTPWGSFFQVLNVQHTDHWRVVAYMTPVQVDEAVTQWQIAGSAPTRVDIW